MFPPPDPDFPARRIVSKSASVQERVLDTFFNLRSTGQLDDMNLTAGLLMNWGDEQVKTGRTIADMWAAAGEGAGDLQKIFGDQDAMVRLLSDNAAFDFSFEGLGLLPNSRRTFASDVIGALKNNPDLAFADAVRAEAAVFNLLMSNEQLTLREATRLVAIEGLGATNDEIRRALTDLPVEARGGKTLTQIDEAAGVPAPTPKASSPGFPDDVMEPVDRIDWAVPPVVGQRKIGIFANGQWYFRQGSADEMSARVFHGLVADDNGIGHDSIEAFFNWSPNVSPDIQSVKGIDLEHFGKLLKSGFPEDMTIGGRTIDDFLGSRVDDPRFIDASGRNFDRTPEQIKAMGVRNNTYKRFAFQWNNIEGTPMYGVLDVDTGRMSYTPPNSPGQRLGCADRTGLLCWQPWTRPT
jgi:hypothetical protein